MALNPIKAFLVDMDGTLVDTGAANYEAYAQALKEVGVTVDRATFEAEALGRNWRQFLPTFLARSGQEDVPPQSVAQRKAQLYAGMASHLRYNEALVGLLRARAPDVRAALVTTASAINVEAVLKTRPDIRALFDVVVTGDDVARHKPDPQAYCIAAERLGVEASTCVVIEDSDIGVAAGCAFGAGVLRVRLD